MQVEADVKACKPLWVGIASPVSEIVLLLHGFEFGPCPPKLVCTSTFIQWAHGFMLRTVPSSYTLSCETCNLEIITLTTLVPSHADTK